MAADGGREADVEIVASAAADELRFDAGPEVRVRFPGTGKRDSHQATERQNLDSPVHGEDVPPSVRSDANHQSPPR
jgi:hypothetical protein